jgi:hypothetical protein
MYLWCELLCNLWWWPLNLLWSWLVCKLVWNPSWFHGLPGYMVLSLLNRLLGGWFSYLILYNWSVLLHVSNWIKSKQVTRIARESRISPRFQFWGNDVYQGISTNSQGLGTYGVKDYQLVNKTWYMTRFINRIVITNNNCFPNIRRKF